MRTLTTPVAGLPAGTEYDVIEDKWGVRRVIWKQEAAGFFPGTLMLHQARVDGRGKLAELTAGGAIYRAHASALGINPETEIPCGRCGAEIPAVLTVCPECGNDPDSETPCPDCTDLSGRALGFVDIMRGDGTHVGRVTCGTCSGALSYESADYRNRIDAIEAAKRWERAQRGEAVPAGIGGAAWEPSADYDPSVPYDCPRCEGEGFIMVCVDDLCRGTGECFYAAAHGGAVLDGCYRRCPDCRGTGEVTDEPKRSGEPGTART